MSKILNQVEKEKLIADYMLLIKKIDGNTNPFVILKFVTEELPNFFQTLVDIGYKAGFNDAKNSKVENLIKNN